MKAVVTYLGHSGFMIDANGRQLVFDYLGEVALAGRLKDAVVFISHAHKDHCSEAALGMIRRGEAVGVVSFDVEKTADWLVVRPGDRVDAAGISVRAFRSTDAGVSFLADAGGLRVFHAGDLNFWHWREESAQDEVRAAYGAFDAALAEIEGERVDIALFPVDPRMGAGHDEGALEFVRRVRPRVIIPMHFWDRPQAAREFCKKPMPQGVRTVCLTDPGQQFVLE